MSYSEWLETIELLKKSNDQDLKNKILKEEVNENINSFLEDKIVDLIKYKFSKSINNFKKNIHEMFSDQNILDLYLVNFKKDLKFIEELTYLKQIDPLIKKALKDNLKEETEKIYSILIKEANNIDNIGLLSMTIKNNMFKWSDNNEL